MNFTAQCLEKYKSPICNGRKFYCPIQINIVIYIVRIDAFNLLYKPLVGGYSHAPIYKTVWWTAMTVHYRFP